MKCTYNYNRVDNVDLYGGIKIKLPSRTPIFVTHMSLE